MNDIFPEIITKRLLLGKLSYRNIPEIIEFAGNPKVAETTLNIPHPYAEQDAIYWINSANQGFENRTQFTFGVYVKSPKQFIGGIGLRINPRFERGEIGYWLAEPFWNNGYATEALGALLKFGFTELNLHKIFANHLIENPASGKVMTKNGMITEAELKDHIKKGDRFLSLVQYRLTNEEYLNLESN